MNDGILVFRAFLPFGSDKNYEIWYMLRNSKKITGFSVLATDGEIGKIRDFIFDEQVWTVRYAEIDIGNLVAGKVVLLSTMILGPTALFSVGTKLTIKQIINCPIIDPHIMPDRKYEEELHNYFSWTYYWAKQSEVSQYQTSYKLQRVKVINGYKVFSLDGEIGHLDDLLLDDLEWKIRYFIVNTGSWFFGKKILLSSTWIRKIDDLTSTILINVNQEKIRTAPTYDSSLLLTREYESSLFTHYDKEPYWNI